MRLFIAVPLPRPALKEAGAVLEGLRELGWPVRWVRDDAMHITLKFFGEVTSDRIDGIEEMLRHAALGVPRMSLVIGQAGGFPDGRRPRVLHLAIQAGPELEVLQDRIERSCGDLGFAPEGRPFVPHVTLGRVREGQRLPADAIRQLEAILPSGRAFPADRVVLFESRLTPAGLVYAERSVQSLAS